MVSTGCVKLAFFRDVNCVLLQQIKEIYNLDFLLFQYSFNEYLSEIGNDNCLNNIMHALR